LISFSTPFPPLLEPPPIQFAANFTLLKRRKRRQNVQKKVLYFDYFWPRRYAKVGIERSLERLNDPEEDPEAPVATRSLHK
jgi:hypothetical protein